MTMPYEEAASEPAYVSAYEKAMTGAESTFTEEERAAVTRVRELAGIAVGYPVPPNLRRLPSEPTHRID